MRLNRPWLAQARIDAVRRFSRRRSMPMPAVARAYAIRHAESFGLTPTAFLSEMLRIVADDDMALAILGDIYSRDPPPDRSALAQRSSHSERTQVAG